MFWKHKKRNEKIGVFICECGPNIRDRMDIEALVLHTENKESVDFVRPYPVLCSEEGKNALMGIIKDRELTRVVIAGCSPLEHEETFRSVLDAAGLNPYLLQIANIREQCAWVHSNRQEVTEKANDIIDGAIARVRLHEALERREVECTSDVLVIGAGIAGMTAAKILADGNRKVTLIDKLPFIGGKAVLYESVLPTIECASCMLSPLMDEVLHHPRINVLTMSRVKKVTGFFGNFLADVETQSRFVDPEKCVGCDICSEACPVETDNEFNQCLDKRKAVSIPIEGLLPHIPVLDKNVCLRFLGYECNACRTACPFGAIRYDQEDTRTEIPIGAIVVATGFDLFDPWHDARRRSGCLENVYTCLEFERLLSPTGPTKGRVQMIDGSVPESVAVILAEDPSYGKAGEAGRQVNISILDKFVQRLRMKLPECSLDVIACSSLESAITGRLTQKDRDKVRIHALKSLDSIEIGDEKTRYRISFGGRSRKAAPVDADMIILITGMVGACESDDLARALGLEQDKARFFRSERSLMDPVSAMREGIYVVGCARAPGDVSGTVMEAQAAAGRILSSLAPGRLIRLESTVSRIDDEKCAACGICIESCPYMAIEMDSNGSVKVNESICRGCGICAGMCPSSAIDSRHFTDDQIFAEIEGIMHAGV